MPRFKNLLIRDTNYWQRKNIWLSSTLSLASSHFLIVWINCHLYPFLNRFYFSKCIVTYAILNHITLKVTMAHKQPTSSSDPPPPASHSNAPPSLSQPRPPPQYLFHRTLSTPQLPSQSNAPFSTQRPQPPYQFIAPSYSSQQPPRPPYQFSRPSFSSQPPQQAHYSFQRSSSSQPARPPYYSITPYSSEPPRSSHSNMEQSFIPPRYRSSMWITPSRSRSPSDPSYSSKASNIKDYICIALAVTSCVIYMSYVVREFIFFCSFFISNIFIYYLIYIYI